jgi:hypothetical protein
MAATIAKKALTPTGLHFNTHSTYSAKKMYDTAVMQIKKMKVTPAVKEACIHILDFSFKGKESFPKMFRGVSPEDIGIMTSDFGEISGPIYLMRKYPQKYKAVRFPTGNEKLIDFILITADGGEEKFSSKAGQGGKPSITSVMPIIEEKIKSRKLNKKFEKPAKVLSILSSNEKDALYWGPLKAAKFLDTPGYEGLIKTLRKLKVKDVQTTTTIPPTSQQLDEAVGNAGSFKSCMAQFNDFFRASKYTEINLGVTKRLIETPRPGKEKRWGILHYPITAELIRWLNDDKNNAKELLTIAAKELTVTQIYMDVYANEVKYTVKEFKEASFKFGSPSSAPRPTNNRIGFTMKK